MALSWLNLPCALKAAFIKADVGDPRRAHRMRRPAYPAPSFQGGGSIREGGSAGLGELGEGEVGGASRSAWEWGQDVK